MSPGMAPEKGFLLSRFKNNILVGALLKFIPTQYQLTQHLSPDLIFTMITIMN